jgi:APA family basic amino acid/polyamine antiporter
VIEEDPAQRVLTLFDLTMIGVGGTVGSGVFSIIGDVASGYCGPAVIIALLIGTVACLLTGYSYVKLSESIPTSGSVYSYSYQCLGEIFAMVASLCLTLEYAVSGFGVATSWGNKLAKYTQISEIAAITVAGFTINLAAAAISLFCVIIISSGMNLSKLFTNVVTVVKVVLVLFMICASLSFFDISHFTPFVPNPPGNPNYGVGGVLQGTVQCFFGYVGFDEVCCLSGRAKDPKRDIPRALTLSLLGAASLTLLAAIGLVGMQDYTAIDPDAGFSEGFRALGVPWAAGITAIGELVTLPVVVFICILPQPELFRQMSADGLLPRFNFNAAIGVLGVLQAGLVNFDTIATLTSAGVLCSFILCSCSHIQMILTGIPIDRLLVETDRGAGKSLVQLCTSSLVSMLLLTGIFFENTGLGSLKAASTGAKVAAIVASTIGFGLAIWAVFAIRRLARGAHNHGAGTVWIPIAAILVNCFMLSTMDLVTFGVFAVCVVVVLLFYFVHRDFREAALAKERPQDRRF